MSLMLTQNFTTEDGCEVTLMTNIDVGVETSLGFLAQHAESAGLTPIKKAKPRTRAKKAPATEVAAATAPAPVVEATPVPIAAPVADVLAPAPGAPAVPVAAPVALVPVVPPTAIAAGTPFAAVPEPAPIPVAPIAAPVPAPVAVDDMAVGWRDAIMGIGTNLKGALPAEKHANVDGLLIEGLRQSGIIVGDAIQAQAAVAAQGSPVLEKVYEVMAANAQNMLNG